ncbi:hypothetical protein Misp06_00167 [Microbulbifer sp. NBRC 101763]
MVHISEIWMETKLLSFRVSNFLRHKDGLYSDKSYIWIFLRIIVNEQRDVS